MTTNIGSKSVIYRIKIQQYLRDFDFKALFVHELGWNTLKEPSLVIAVDGATYILHTLAEKRGVKAFLCDPNAGGQIPADSIVRKIEREVTNHAAYEHFIIYVDATKEHQVWQWVKRDQNKRAISRINRYHKSQSGDRSLNALRLDWTKKST